MLRRVVLQARSCWNCMYARPGLYNIPVQVICFHSAFSEKPRTDASSLPFQWLKLKAQEFRVSGHDVRILHEPSEFYEIIKENIESSQERIVLASLYLGNGPMEKELVHSIHKACERAQKNGDSLNIHVLLDCVRGSRGTDNSRTMLLPLLQEFGHQMSVSLYHTPELRGSKKALIPERFNEAIGLSHLKVYAFDDTLLLSGANLSEMYFTNRQDRYIVIRNCPELVTFFIKLVLAVSSISFQLHPDNSLSLYNEDSIHPFEGDLDKFRLNGHRIIQNILDSADNEKDRHLVSKWQRTVLDRRPIYSTQGSINSHRTEKEHHICSSNSNHHLTNSNDRSKESPSGINFSAVSNSNISLSPSAQQSRNENNDEKGILRTKDASSTEANIAKTYTSSRAMCNTRDAYEKSKPTQAFEQRTEKRISNTKLSDVGVGEAEKDTSIFPLVQMGPLGITVDQDVTRQLLGDGEEESVCYLASGYFNLTAEYMNTILGSRPTFEMLMASPQVNGFYGSKGISGYIPASYTFIARQFHRALCSRGQQHRIRLYEYYRDAWTFHVKGLWYYLPNEKLPSLTLIGSPNFGHRSVHRDLEAQLAIVTSNESLREQLHREQTRLYKLSEKVDETTYKQPDRKVPLWTRLVTIVTRNFF